MYRERVIGSEGVLEVQWHFERGAVWLENAFAVAGLFRNRRCFDKALLREATKAREFVAKRSSFPTPLNFTVCCVSFQLSPSAPNFASSPLFWGRG